MVTVQHYHEGFGHVLTGPQILCSFGYRPNNSLIHSVLTSTNILMKQEIGCGNRVYSKAKLFCRGAHFSVQYNNSQRKCVVWSCRRKSWTNLDQRLVSVPLTKMIVFNMAKETHLNKTRQNNRLTGQYQHPHACRETQFDNHGFFYLFLI